MSQHQAETTGIDQGAPHPEFKAAITVPADWKARLADTKALLDVHKQLEQKTRECEELTRQRDAHAQESDHKGHEIERLRARMQLAHNSLEEAHKQLKLEQAHHQAMKAVFDTQQQSLEDTQLLMMAAQNQMKELIDKNDALQRKALQDEITVKSLLVQNEQLEAQLNAVQSTLENLGALVQGAGAQLKFPRSPPLPAAADPAAADPAAVHTQAQQRAALPPAPECLSAYHPPCGWLAATHDESGLKRGSQSGAMPTSPRIPAGLPTFGGAHPPDGAVGDHAPMRALSDRPFAGSDAAVAGDASQQLQALRQSSLLSDLILAHLNGTTPHHASPPPPPAPTAAQIPEGTLNTHALFMGLLNKRGSEVSGGGDDRRRDVLVQAALQVQHASGASPQQPPPPPSAASARVNGGDGPEANQALCRTESAETPREVTVQDAAAPADASEAADQAEPEDPDGGDRQKEVKQYSSRPRRVSHPPDRLGSGESDLSCDSYTEKPPASRPKRGAARDSLPKNVKKLKNIKTQSAATAQGLEMLADLALQPHVEEDEEDATPLAVAQSQQLAYNGPHPIRLQNIVSKHGRRINPRKGIPMHVMATYALLRLPNHEGNLTDMATKIEENEMFCKQLDWTPRPGTKTYPRWKDALVGCFKPGRYPHLMKTDKKRESLTVYTLIEDKIPEKSMLDNSHVPCSPHSSPAVGELGAAAVEAFGAH